MKERYGKRSLGVSRWTEALSWYVTLRAVDETDLANRTSRQWLDWYADAENQRVFDDVVRLLSDRDLYRKRRRPAKVKIQEDPYDLFAPIAEWLRTQAREKFQNRRLSVGKWLWFSGAFGVIAITAVVVFWPMKFGSRASGSGALVYQTRVGGLKNVELRDGSRITLGGQTEISVAFSPKRRSVQLLEGQAWFKVAHNPRWPFVVTAGHGTITAVGTAFLVTRESDRVIVTVTEGTVLVSARPPPLWSAVRLKQAIPMSPVLAPLRVIRGEELAFNAGGPRGPVRLADTNSATAWTHGQLTFDDEALSYVVDTLNRYSMRRIVVGPTAGALRLTAIVFAKDIGDWLQSLPAILPVTVQERGAAFYIQMRPSPPAPPTRAPPRTTPP